MFFFTISACICFFGHCWRVLVHFFRTFCDKVLSVISSLGTISPGYLVKCSIAYIFVSCFVCVLISTSQSDIGLPVVCDCGIVVVVVRFFLFCLFFVCFCCCCCIII